jgi:hypothetical protein
VRGFVVNILGVVSGKLQSRAQAEIEIHCAAEDF